MSHLVFDLITMQRGGQRSLGGMDCGGNGSWLPSNAASSSKVGGIKTKKPEAWGGGQPEMLEGSAGVTQMSLDSGGTASSLPGVRAVSS